jgi:hypothetical protein
VEISVYLWYNLSTLKKILLGVIYMQKKYSVAETTRVEREKIANDALGISTLDAAEPTLQTKELVNQYIMGNLEISDILEKTINRYKVAKV